MINLCAILSILRRHSEAAIYAHDAIRLLEIESKSIEQQLAIEKEDEESKSP